MTLNTKGTHFDFIVAALSSGGLTQDQVNIIESNTGTQINVYVKKTKLTWNNDTPKKLVLVEKYEDATLTNKLYTTTLNWNGNQLANVVIVNEDDNITETTTLTFVDGYLIDVEKV